MFGRRHPLDSIPAPMRVVTDSGEHPFDVINRFADMKPGVTYLWQRMPQHVPSHMGQRVFVPRNPDLTDTQWTDIVIESRNSMADVIAVTVVSNNGYTVVMENRLGQGVISLDYKKGGPPPSPEPPLELSE